MDWHWLIVYGAAPAADLAANHGLSWVSLAGLAIAGGGLLCHVIQTVAVVRKARMPEPVYPLRPRVFVPRDLDQPD